MTATSTRRPVERDRSPPAKRPKSHQRRYGFACSNCRRRKAKCDGEYPACDKCTNNKEDCSYDKGPSVAYAVSLQKQLKSYEDCFEQLRQAATNQRLALLDEFITNDRLSEVQPKNSSSDLTPSRGEVIRGSTGRESNSRIEQPDETSLGVDGGICFYGKTSLYHVEPQENGNQTPLAPGDSLQNERASTEHNPSVATASYTSPTYFSGHDSSLASVRSEVPPETFNELLAAYWCLPHHLHLVLCKSVFLRDLFTAGPYMTPFLLSSVLAQAARYCDRSDNIEIGNHFASRALQLLPQDIDRGSLIPTIQGLLILSSREVACGRTAQGWLYSGMAFRMMRDLGLHVAPKKLGYLARQFSDEDLAVRQQLFWSCYTWDKTMSLCLGRAPTIHDVIEFPTPDTIVDGRTSDEEPWVPLAAQGRALKTSPTQRALSSVRFAAYCELATIIDDVLDVLYSRPQNGRDIRLLDYLATGLRKLEQWSSELPKDLFIARGSKTVICPPLHVLLLNLLYHATTILLSRPYRHKSQRARTACTEAARMIDVLFTLHVRRFGFKYITYLQTYTMFVASTINVLDFQENTDQPMSSDEAGAEQSRLFADEASARLDFGLEVLRQAGSTPSAARCAAIIVRLLKKTGEGETPSNTKSDEQSSSWANRQISSLAAPFNTGTDGQRQSAVYGQNQELPHAAIYSHSQQELAGEVFPPQHSSASSLPPGQGPVPQLAALEYSPTPIEHVRDSLDCMRDQAGAGVIETPLRWLPENMQDDGSWMLMLDGDPNYTFMANYQP